MHHRAFRTRRGFRLGTGWALAFLVTVGGIAAADPSPGWRCEIVDPAATTGDFSSLALDALGRPHVCYVDSMTGSIRYAVRTAAGWSLETIHANDHPYQETSTPFNFHRTAIAIGADGNPRVFYALLANDAEPFVTEGWYAYRSGGSWHREKVADDCNATASLALDSAGQPHVAYYGYYARKVAGSWQAEPVGASYNQVDLDALDQPHLVYGNPYEVRYARKIGGIWSEEVLPAWPIEWPMWVSFDLDALGVPHVVRYNFADRYFTHFWKDGGYWDYDSIDYYPAAGACNDLATEPDGTPHVSMWYRGYLGHGRQTPSGWAIEYGDPGITGLVRAVGTGLALDGHGMPHISYSEYLARDLRVAWLPPPGVSDPDSSEVTSVAHCPSGNLPMAVRVRDGYGDALAGVKVELSFVLADTARLCGPDGSEDYTFERGRYVVSKLTGPDGWAYLQLRGGGIAYARSVQILADSVELGWWPVASCDQDGDGAVGAVDAATFAAKVALGGYDPTADLDANGVVDLADQASFDAHLASAEHCLGTATVEPGRSARPLLRGGMPNPVRTRAVFEFVLPARASARFVVSDLAGRTLREELAGEDLAVGAHRWRWDGTDGRGRRVAAGVYFVTMEALGSRHTVRAVVLD